MCSATVRIVYCKDFLSYRKDFLSYRKYFSITVIRLFTSDFITGSLPLLKSKSLCGLWPLPKFGWKFLLDFSIFRVLTMSLIDLDHQTFQHKIESDQSPQNFSIKYFNFVRQFHNFPYSIEAFLIRWFTNKHQISNLQTSDKPGKVAETVHTVQ